MAIPMMLVQYFPTGLLGLGLTALMASFMSGMAGNVTAFNTVWTYDIYQSYIAPKRSDTHYLWMGRMATVFGILVSIAAAYVATRFNNIMDFIQLVFGFVNAPLFATFLLGMFWKRTTGHGAFFGLLAGTGASALHTALTGPTGHWLSIDHWLDHKTVYDYGSVMAQNFWMAIYAWTTCFVVTVVISLLTKRKKSDDELRGLVYSLTDRFSGDDHLRWYRQTGGVGCHHDNDHDRAEHHFLVKREEKTMLDIRIPIGLMFSILGAILAVFGAVSWYPPDIYDVHSFRINVNLGWGCVLLAFGIFMLMMAYVGSQRAKKRKDSK